MDFRISNFLPLVFFLMLGHTAVSQKQGYTRADSLRGTYGPGRAWWDVLHYDLSVNFAIDDSSISGINVMTYRVLEPADVMQIDLMTPTALCRMDNPVRGKGTVMLFL